MHPVRDKRAWFVVALVGMVLAGCGTGGPDFATGPSLHTQPPSGVLAAAVGRPTSITVSCDAVTGCWLYWSGNELWDDAIIYRSTTGDFATAQQIGKEWASLAFYWDENVEAGTQYHYWVVFVDDAGNRSTLSSSASGTVPHDPFAETTPTPAPPETVAEQETSSAETTSTPETSGMEFFPVALAAPTDIDGDELLIGIRGGDTPPHPTRSGVLNGITIGAATTHDGIGKWALAAFLRDAAVLENSLTGIPGVFRWEKPAVVTYGGGDLRQEDVDLLAHAIRIVNAALPLEWRLQMSADDPIPKSGIHVEFWSEWDYQARLVEGCSSESWGCASTQPHPLSWAIAYSDITINRAYMGDGTRGAVEVLVHELVHALGLGHVGIWQASLMRPHGNFNDWNPPVMALHPIDRAALRAMYGRMEPGDTYDDFGEWSNEWNHIIGYGEHVDFGVAWGNGYGEPWAIGDRPRTALADNPRLEGAAVWSGMLFGFTPGVNVVKGGATPVRGVATIGVDLPTLDGTAAFTDMQMVQTDYSLAQWGKGYLLYEIAISGNHFMQTGGDEGYLTGAFFGPYHESVGGTLEREDLTAAFGAER